MRLPTVFAIVAALAVTSARALASGTGPGKISLPNGPGSIEGMGRNFVPSLASGTSSFGLDIAVPPAVAGFGPALSLEYDSGGGVTEVGMGWRLGGVPRIRRRTENGLPRFDASDTFELVGLGIPCDLISMGNGIYRPAYESGGFVRVIRSPDGTSWEARDKAGVTYRFGGTGVDEEEGEDVATYLLREQRDLHGHSIRYDWDTSEGHALLTRVVWNETADSARNAILFEYETRPDRHVRFASGIRQVLTRRLASIEVRHGGALVRRYALEYAPGFHSVLGKVRMVGRDGMTALPELALGTTQLSFNPPGEVITMTTPPGQSPSDRNVDLADLDGDGLPDLLVTRAGQYQSYANHDGIRWNQPQSWKPDNSPSAELSEHGVQLSDVDGDGAIDILVKSGTSDLRYFPGRDATSFGSAIRIATVPNVTFEDPDVRLADMDGDRRVDVIVTSANGIGVGYNVGGRDWTPIETLGVVDARQPLRFSDGHTTLCDVNGDRVLDLCYLRSGSMTYWLGRGRGRFEPGQSASGVPQYDDSSPWELHDLDGDGWVDLVHVGETQVDMVLAEGEGRFGDVRSITTTPKKSPTTTVRFADMNGSGSTDIVWIDIAGAPENAWRYLELFPNGRAGLLTQIDNGLGKVVHVRYAPAARDAAEARDRGTPWATRMNVPMPVVKEVVVDDSVGDPSTRAEYAYRNGTWDATERTFAGFGGGVLREIGDEHTPTRVTESVFDTGIDRRALRGSLLWIESRDETGTVFFRRIIDYEIKLLDGRIEYGCKRSERMEHVEGGVESQKRDTLVEWEHDEYGNETAERRWGEVIGDDKLASHDEAIMFRTYANNVDDWILGRLATEELQDARGHRVALKRFYYDGELFVGLPLGQVTRGDISRLEEWVGPSPDAFEVSAASIHDQHGNVLETRDGQGGRRMYEWDAPSAAAIVAESVDTGTRVLTDRATYDPAFGTMLTFTGRDGAVSSFEYDALGRLTVVIKPGDSSQRPTVRYSYEYGVPLSRIITERRTESGGDDVSRTVLVHDGLGRHRASLLEEENGRWILAGVGLLDARANAWRNLRARFVDSMIVRSGDLLEDGVGDSVWRDAMSRSVRARSAGGIGTLTRYEPLRKSTWDGAQADPTSPYEHTPTVEASDGLGRLAVKSWTLNGKPVTTSYQYDSEGKLVVLTDPEGNTTSFEHDGRGRTVRVNDPDTGNHRFLFDAANNLVAHIHPDGKTSRFTHDLLGRAVAEDWDGDGQSEVTRTYDEGGDRFLGQLSRVNDPSGTATYTYDERGRLAERTLQISGTSYTNRYAYDALDREIVHTYPDGSSVQIAYGKRGLVHRLGQNAVTFRYDADGAELSRTYATGMHETFGYDQDRRFVEHRATTRSGVIAQHLRWTLDGANNVLEEQDGRSDVDPEASRTIRYQYDNLYRLVRASGGSGETNWSYSASGNLLSRVSTVPGLNAGAMDHGQGAGPHALTSYQGRAVRYDARGRMVDDGARTYQWNDVDRLVAVVSNNGSRVENTFDGDGRRRVRVEQDSSGMARTTLFLDDWSEAQDGAVVRYLVHHGQRIVRLSPQNGVQTSTVGGVEPAAARSRSLSRLASGALAHLDRLLLAIAALVMLTIRERLASAKLPRASRRAAFAMASLGMLFALACGATEPAAADLAGPVVTLTDQDQVLLSDRLGSLTEVTSGTGRPLGSFATLPYGATRYDTAKAESRKFARSSRDTGVGLDQMGARFYAPDLGVWLSPDPLVFSNASQLIGAHPSQSAYAYGGSNPATLVDEDGQNPAPVLFGAAALIGIVCTTQFANAPTRADEPLKHKGTGELAADMTHNSLRAYGYLTLPGTAATMGRTIVSGEVLTGLRMVAKRYVYNEAVRKVGDLADRVDHSGNLRKGIEIGIGLARIRAGSAKKMAPTGASASPGPTGRASSPEPTPGRPGNGSTSGSGASESAPTSRAYGGDAHEAGGYRTTSAVSGPSQPRIDSRIWSESGYYTFIPLIRFMPAQGESSGRSAEPPHPMAPVAATF